MFRQKILRKPGQANYPTYVCKRCGTYAAEDSVTRVQEHVEYELNRCGICSTLTLVAIPYDFGHPEFYTYKNGAPVQGG
jgi:hypothetical protein